MNNYGSYIFILYTCALFLIIKVLILYFVSSFVLIKIDFITIYLCIVCVCVCVKISCKTNYAGKFIFYI